MVLGDYTIDSNVTLTSPNDSPTTNPSVRIVDNRSGSSLNSAPNIPSGNTINGVDIRGRNIGQVETYFMLDAISGATPIHGAGVYFRYIDANNWYCAGIHRRSDIVTKTWFVIVNNAGIKSEIATGNISQTINDATWYKMRITWWEATGQLFVRIEFSDNGGASWTQLNPGNTAHASNLHKSASNKIGWGAQNINLNGGAQSYAVQFDDFRVYGA
ncbi:hypothetical protein Ngar_c15750 [Candidatus Nitrososphaera gargensis Ga9.2]|uniref:Uncharacterized protein n=1 Tax=Nitrososphaera gargensis (strain Ga9.2) TaxID=1237085 RepID=K0IHU0_NITGG|nr:hypothetical protein [Candidatus Nitrososphaera gargensis]AFU58508.1 hypothetical protein Ngar_c15750 [Candidatus Nitrososphaera gargensis Ga9.2]